MYIDPSDGLDLIDGGCRERHRSATPKRVDSRFRGGVKMNDAREVDVLVIGAGPTGLTLASELLRHGASVRLCEQLTEPVTYSKAAVVHARTMELFDAMGIAAPMIERSRIVHGMNVYSGGKRVAHIGFDGLIDSPYPHAYGLSQHDTEEVLAAHFARLGGTIERGVRLDSFSQDAEGVRATVVGSGDRREEIRAGWLVGCDGAHSTVRKTLRFSFEGAPYEEKLIQADVRVSFAQKFEEDEILTFLDEHGPAMMFPLFRDGRYRLILLNAGATDDVPAEPRLEDFQRGLDARGIDARVSDPAWTVAFRIHHRHVERLREGRVFLAGDAAHIHSPTGGQGMNTGIQDAVNLAWKLALTARGRGRPALLDSYEPERLPVIRALIAQTDRATRAIDTAVKLRHPIAVALRNQLMSLATSLGVVQAQATASLAMLGVGYPDSPLCAQDRPTIWGTDVMARQDSESPTVRDWVAFGGGPAPGQRAPDAEARGGTGSEPRRVHELVRSGRHVALLFDGAAATEAGYANLTRIARSVRGRFGDAVEPYLVVPTATAPAPARWEGPTLLDEGGEIHQRYGARSEAIYLIRPDGYVGYRGQPAEGAKLEAWLDRCLEPVG
jgi:2-polyprenyl-6-methoxyphenol hydroxylase-like FAD-dependent oxidoreductase